MSIRPADANAQDSQPFLQQIVQGVESATYSVALTATHMMMASTGVAFSACAAVVAGIAYASFQAAFLAWGIGIGITALGIIVTGIGSPIVAGLGLAILGQMALQVTFVGLIVLGISALAVAALKVSILAVNALASYAATACLA